MKNKKQKLVPQFEKKIRKILKSQKLEADKLKKVIAIGKEKIRKKEYITPTVHLRCRHKKSGKLFYARFLIWDDPWWKQSRIKCIKAQRELSQKLNRGAFFQVPKIIASGTSPLVWDVSEFINGHHLQWSNHSYRKLDNYLGRVKVLVQINQKLKKLKSPSARKVDWDWMLKNYLRIIGYVHSRDIIGEDKKKSFEQFGNLFIEKYLRENPLVLTHGDYNLKNVLFSQKNNKPYLLDWDHVRYSVPGDSYARLWMFVSNEPRWQKRLEKEILPVFKNEAQWNGFLFFAIYETLKQCEHECLVTNRPVKSWSHLKKISPKRSRLIFWYRQALYRLLSKRPLPKE